MRTRQEQINAALCHLFNAVPLWGLLFCGWVTFSLREESRAVVRHARQAMYFHALLMAVLLLFFMLELVTRLLRVVWQPLGDLLHVVNVVIVCVLLTAYVLVCAYGALQCYHGLPFRYPLLGRRSAG